MSLTANSNLAELVRQGYLGVYEESNVIRVRTATSHLYQFLQSRMTTLVTYVIDS